MDIIEYLWYASKEARRKGYGFIAVPYYRYQEFCEFIWLAAPWTGRWNPYEVQCFGFPVALQEEPR